MNRDQDLSCKYLGHLKKMEEYGQSSYNSDRRLTVILFEWQLPVIPSFTCVLKDETNIN